MNKRFFNENVKGMPIRVAITMIYEIITIPCFWIVQDGVVAQLIGGVIALLFLIFNIRALYHQNDNITRQRTNELGIERGIRILFWEIPMGIEGCLETISITVGVIVFIVCFVISLLIRSELSALILTIAAATVSICQLFKVRFYSLLDTVVTSVTAIMALYLLIIKPVNTMTNYNIELSVWNGISFIILSISIYQEYQFIAENKKALEEKGKDEVRSGNDMLSCFTWPRFWNMASLVMLVISIHQSYQSIIENKNALEQEKNKEIRSKIEEILTKNLEQLKKDNSAIDVSEITQEIMDTIKGSR